MFIINVVPAEQRVAFAEEAAPLLVSMDPWITLGTDIARARVLLSDLEKQVHVARTEEGELQGLMILDLTGPFRSYVHILCVAPKWQGKGLAKQLIGIAEEIAFRIGPNLFICSSSFNPRARKLYESCGFVQCGVLTDYIVRGHDEILLRKSIGTRSDFLKGLLKK
jgi:ribosomal protein S18 acetylase RimI-like enzyme